MVSKKLLAVCAALFLSVNLWANEEFFNTPVDKCETDYSQCMEKCDSNEGNNESCYDKCDESYSKCLEAFQTSN